MAQTPPPAVTPFTDEAPVRHQRATFSLRLDAFVTWLFSGVSEVVAVVTNCYDNAVDAYQSAVAAAASALAAANQVTLSAEQVALATIQANAAASSAATAVAAPGTSATSASSLSIATGPQMLTIQTGKSLAAGMTVVIARTSDPVYTRMVGVISDYNSGTGALNVTVGDKLGTGTFSDWTVSLSGATGQAGTTAAPVYKTADFAVIAGTGYLTDTSSAAFVATMPPSPALGDAVIFYDAKNTWHINNLTLARNGHNFVDRYGNSVAEDLICDVGGMQLLVFFDATNWKLI